MTRALAAGLLIACLLAGTARPARAAKLDDVRKAGVVRCGGAIRPGLAFPDSVGWHGLEVEFCRAVAAAVLGDPARIEFRSYVTAEQFARARPGTDGDDVSFLTASELFANGLLGHVLPGPAVFYQTTRIMVWNERAARHVADLRGVTVCAEPGTGPERNLQEYMLRHAIPFRFSMWQELEEMVDAFNGGRCPAMAGEETALAALRLGSEQDGHPSRLLPEPLAATPVAAFTPGDPAWARIVFWTVQTVLAADRVGRVQGSSLPLDAPESEMGLATGWQARVVGAVGTYAEVFRRTLGVDSALKLAPGLNARWSEEGVFAPPSVE